MKRVFYITIIALLLFSCASQPRLVCQEPLYIKGRVLLAKQESKKFRTILYDTPSGKMVIYNVPMDVDLDIIPVCIDYHSIVYFKKN